MIPKPIKTVFDTFPLITNPPTSNTTPANSQYIDDKKFYFGGKSAGSFLLGVHNTFQHIDESGATRILPTDPESLAYALILAYKNKLTLPRPGSKGTNALFAISYHSSPSDQLPVLIEQRENKSSENKGEKGQENDLHLDKQCTDPVNLLNDHSQRSFINLSQVLTKYFVKSPTAQLINRLMDSQFQDLWILCLLTEDLDLQTWNTLFDVDPEVFTNSTINKLVVHHILTDLPSWHDFSVRHPNLFDVPSKTLGVEFLFKSELIEAQYELQLEEFDYTLGAVYEYIRTSEKSAALEILEMKLASFVVIFKLLLRDTKLGEMVAGNVKVVEFAEGVIAKY